MKHSINELVVEKSVTTYGYTEQRRFLLVLPFDSKMYVRVTEDIEGTPFEESKEIDVDDFPQYVADTVGVDILARWEGKTLYLTDPNSERTLGKTDYDKVTDFIIDKVLTDMGEHFGDFA